MIHAGALNKKITIQYQAKARDSFGAEVITWTDAATVWAKITPLRGKEFFAAQQINAESTIKISIRYRSNINTTMRLKYGSRYFYILEMHNVDERSEELLFYCKEVV